MDPESQTGILILYYNTMSNKFDPQKAIKFQGLVQHGHLDILKTHTQRWVLLTNVILNKIKKNLE